LVTRIELDACDTNPAASVTAELLLITDLDAAVIQLVSVSTGIAATPGCAHFVGTLAFPATIDNLHNTYNVQVGITGADDTTRFWIVRVFYLLQMSPAPATATFNDVPTSDPYFPFIEALAAAGITVGCNTSPPLFCPDNPVTRRQIAVFLSKALGLHFAP
jgi:hypothetical protein